MFRRLRETHTPPRKLTSPPAGPPPTFNSTLANMYEDVGDDGSHDPAKAGFTAEGGKSHRLWQITPDSVEDLITAFPMILGDCKYAASGTGKLSRTLPLADPVFAWLYASSLPEITGYGKYNQVTADPELEAAGFPNGTLWDQYRVAVESIPRPFPVLSDNYVQNTQSTWYPEVDGGTTFVVGDVANEQTRYCTWDLQPQNDYITQQRGRMAFVSQDDTNGSTYAAMPRVFLPNQIYTITWYYVPVRLIISPNSTIRKYRGRINQSQFIGPDGFQFNPGELLYLSYSQKIFTPPIQNLVQLGGYPPTIVSTEKFAHITFTFLYTQRTNVSTPVTPPTNKNYVVGGHNLLPWHDGNFRYAQCQIPDTGFASNFRPAWLSAPFEALFTDCDSPGALL